MQVLYKDIETGKVLFTTWGEGLPRADGLIEFNEEERVSRGLFKGADYNRTQTFWRVANSRLVVSSQQESRNGSETYNSYHGEVFITKS